ncbi:hypothetical protein ARMGADRAFT_1076713 [Armillaria gallica]|uniref:Uncharacterized protein n=1 Tax=Armillaria gallica TaxID=47427 RepID=A0A2H3DMV9_ARMGA|nr:hypothetical protein ARMGADRAFT_1076713 [Armillaria gallica]
MPYLAPGFSNNQQLDNLYYQDVDRHNKLTPTQFLEIVRTHVYGTRWHLDIRCDVETFQQGDQLNQEHLKDSQLMPMIKSQMNEDLHDCFAETGLEMSKLYMLIVDGKADPKKDNKTMNHWAQLVELEDEKLRQERDKLEANASWLPTTCHFPFQNHCKSDNVCAPCVALDYQVHDIKFVNHWVQAHPNGFENCRIHDPSIISCKLYMITPERVAEAVARQQMKGSIIPQYFLNITQTMNAGSSSYYSAASSSNAIPLGPASHSLNVTPIHAIPHNYIAPVLHKHAFPPSDNLSRPTSCTSYNDSHPSSDSLPASHQLNLPTLMPPFSNCAIVGVENNEDRYINADSSGYDEPLSSPPCNVCPRHSHHSFSTNLEDLDHASTKPKTGRHAETEP